MKKKVLIGIGIALGVLLFLLFLGFVWFMTGEPTISVNYVKKLNELVRPAGATGDQNAWPYYQQAFQLYVEPNDVIFWVIGNVQWEDNTHHRFSQFPTDDRIIIKEWISQHQDELEQLNDEDKAAFKDMFSKHDIPKIISYKEYECLDSFLPGVLDSEERIDRLYLIGRRISERIIDNSFPENWYHGVAAELLSQWIKQCEAEENQIPTWIRLNETAWQEMVKGNRKPYCWFDHDERGRILKSFPKPSWFRTAGELGVWKAFMARQQGNIDQSFDICIEIVEMGKKIKIPNENILTQNDGISVMKMGFKEILQTLTSDQITSDNLSAVQQKLEKLFENEYPMTNYECERLLFQECVQMVFTEGGPGGGHIIPADPLKYSGGYIGDWGDSFSSFFDYVFHAGRDKTVAKANELYDHLNKLSEYRPYEIRQGRVMSIKQLKVYLPRTKFCLVHLLVFHDGYNILDNRCKAYLEAAITVAALKRWKLEKGQYPERLEELLEGWYLEELPEDPYGPGVLTYERRGEDFILYSWGADFDDDGGVENPNSFWGRGEEGGDYVFWPIKIE